MVAHWKKVKGKMSLHVHCHISGGHFLLDFIAKLRHYIFCKELPVVGKSNRVNIISKTPTHQTKPYQPMLLPSIFAQVLMAFVHGDGNLFNAHPELEEAMVWVYFQSNLQEYNRVECWGPLREAAVRGGAWAEQPTKEGQPPEPCCMECSCCFPPASLIPWPHDLPDHEGPIQLSNVAAD